jgi:hypothetical protein
LSFVSLMVIRGGSSAAAPQANRHDTALAPGKQDSA